MTSILVDSNVILDLTEQASPHHEWSRKILGRYGQSMPLVINAIVFSQISVRYRTMEDVDEAVTPDLFRREHIPWEAAFLAGKCFLDYRRRGGGRTAPLPDFFIGAHAAVRGYRLLTRDLRRYRTYFPSLELIAPA